MSLKWLSRFMTLALVALLSPVATAGIDIDSDGDSVVDAIDVCCATPPGILVDAEGRPLADFDSDCHVDLDDHLLAYTTLTLDQFAVLQNNFTGDLPPDPPCPAVCGNGVVETGEQCDDGGESAACDTDCTAAQCGDGTVNVTAGEECDDGGETAACDADCTAAQCGDGTVNVTAGEQCDDGGESAACDADCTAALCGDGTVNATVGEECDDGGESAACDADCTATQCGDGTVNVTAGEQCDPPDGCTCDSGCQLITGVGPINDDCSCPIGIGEGTLTFSNEDATTDGPDEPVACDVWGYTQIGSDIWYCYTATCTETVIVSVCGSQYDTKLAVYDGCACPQPGAVACSDDDCGLSNSSSRATFQAVAGESYTIRIGGFDGAQGTGILSVFCESDPDHGLNACRAGTGDCLSGNGTPGCDDPESCPEICEQLCGLDPYCCDTQWDGLCGEEADGICNGFPACNVDSGSCSADKEEAGCEVVDCCQTVCEQDLLCCTDRWDPICAGEAEDLCGIFAACENAAGSCFDAHANTGCDVQSCCNEICAVDQTCCSVGWDATCAQEAVTYCPQ